MVPSVISSTKVNLLKEIEVKDLHLIPPESQPQIEPIIFLELPRDIEEQKVIASGLLSANYQITNVAGEEEEDKPTQETLKKLITLLQEAQTEGLSLKNLFSVQTEALKEKIHYFAIVGSGARHCISENEIVERFEKRGVKFLLFNEDGSPTRFLRCIRAAANDIDGRTVLAPETGSRDIEVCSGVLKGLLPTAFVSPSGEFTIFRHGKIDITIGQFTSKRFSPYLFENTRFEIHILDPSAIETGLSLSSIKYETFGKSFLQFLCYQGLEIIDAENPEQRNYCTIVNYFVKVLKGGICHNPNLVPIFFNTFFEKYQYQGVNWPSKAASMMRHIAEAHTNDRGHIMIYLAFLMELAADQISNNHKHLSTSSCWQMLWNELFNEADWEKYRSISNPLYTLRHYKRVPIEHIETLLGIAGMAWISMSSESTHYSLTRYQGKPALYVGMQKFGDKAEKPNQLLISFDLMKWVENLSHSFYDRFSENERLELLFSFFHYPTISSNQQTILSKYTKLIHDPTSLLDKVDQFILKNDLFSLAIAAILLTALAECKHAGSTERLLIEVLPKLYTNNKSGQIKTFKHFLANYVLKPFVCQTHQDIKDALVKNNWWLALAKTGSTYCCELVSKHFSSTSIAEKQHILTHIWRYAPLAAVSHLVSDPTTYPSEFIFYIFSRYPLNPQCISKRDLLSDQIACLLAVFIKVTESGHKLPLENIVSFFFQHRVDLHLQLYQLATLEIDPQDPQYKKILSAYTIRFNAKEHLQLFRAQVEAKSYRLAYSTFILLAKHEKSLSLSEQKEFDAIAVQFCHLHWNSLDTVLQKVKFALSLEIQMERRKHLQKAFLNELIHEFDKAMMNTSTTREFSKVLSNWFKITLQDKEFTPFIELKILHILDFYIELTATIENPIGKPKYVTYQLLVQASQHPLFKVNPSRAQLHTAIYRFCRQSSNHPNSFPINKTAELFLKTDVIKQNRLILDIIGLLIGSISIQDIQLCYALAKRIDLGLLQGEDSVRWQALTRQFRLIAYHTLDQQNLEDSAEMIRTIKQYEEAYFQLRLDAFARRILSGSNNAHESLIFLLKNVSLLNNVQRTQLIHLLFCYLNQPVLKELDWIFQQCLSCINKHERCQVIDHFIKVKNPIPTNKLFQWLLNEIQILGRNPTPDELALVANCMQYILTHYTLIEKQQRSSILQLLHPYILPIHHDLWQTFALAITRGLLEDNRMRDAIMCLQYLDDISALSLQDELVANLTTALNSQNPDFTTLAQLFIRFPIQISMNDWMALWGKVSNQKCVESLSSVFLQTFPLEQVEKSSRHLHLHKEILKKVLIQRNALTKQYLIDPSFAKCLKCFAKGDSKTEFLLPDIFEIALEHRNGMLIEELFKVFYYKLFDDANRIKVCNYYMIASLYFPAKCVKSAKNQIFEFYNKSTPKPNKLLEESLLYIEHFSKATHFENASVKIALIDFAFVHYFKNLTQKQILSSIEGLIKLIQFEKCKNNTSNTLFWKLISLCMDLKKELVLLLSPYKEVLVTLFESSISNRKCDIDCDISYPMHLLFLLKINSKDLNKIVIEFLNIYLYKITEQESSSKASKIGARRVFELFGLIKFSNDEQNKQLNELLLKSVNCTFNVIIEYNVEISNVTIDNVVKYNYQVNNNYSLFTHTSLKFAIEILNNLIDRSTQNWKTFFITLPAIFSHLNVITSNFEKDKNLQKNHLQIYGNIYCLIMHLHIYFSHHSSAFNNLWKHISKHLNPLFAVMHKVLDAKFPIQIGFSPTLPLPDKMFNYMRVFNMNDIGLFWKTYKHTFEKSSFEPHRFFEASILFSSQIEDVVNRLDNFNSLSIQITNDNYLVRMLEINYFKAFEVIDKFFSEYSNALLGLDISSTELVNEYLYESSLGYLVFLTKLHDYGESINSIQPLAQYFILLDKWFNTVVELAKKGMSFTDESAPWLVQPFSYLLTTPKLKLASIVHNAVLSALKKFESYVNLRPQCSSLIQYFVTTGHPSRLKIQELIESLNDEMFPYIAAADLKLCGTATHIISSQNMYFRSCIGHLDNDDSGKTNQVYNSALKSLKYSILTLNILSNQPILEDDRSTLIIHCQKLIMLLFQDGHIEHALSLLLTILESPIGYDFAKNNCMAIEKLTTFCLSQNIYEKLTFFAFYYLGFKGFWNELTEEKENLLNEIFNILFPNKKNNWREIIVSFVNSEIATGNTDKIAWCLALPTGSVDRLSILAAIQSSKIEPMLLFLTALTLTDPKEVTVFVEQDTSLLHVLPDLTRVYRNYIVDFLYSKLFMAYENHKPTYLRQSIANLIIVLKNEIHYNADYLLTKLLKGKYNSNLLQVIKEYYGISLCLTDPTCLEIIDQTIEEITLYCGTILSNQDCLDLKIYIQQFLRAMLKSEKYSSQIIVNRFDSLKKILFGFDILTEQEMVYCIELMSNQDPDFVINIDDTLVPSNVIQAVDIKLADRYLSTDSNRAYKLINRFLSQFACQNQDENKWPDGCVDTLLSVIASVDSPQFSLFAKLVHWFITNSPSSLSGIDFTQKVLRFVEELNGVSEALDIFCVLVNSNLICLNGDVLSFCLNRIKQQCSEGVILMKRLTSIPEPIVITTAKGYVKLLNQGSFNVSFLAEGIQNVNYLNLTLKTKQYVDILWYEMMTNIELANINHFPANILNTYSVLEIGGTLSAKKQSKLSYCFYKLFVDGIAKLSTKQRINLLHLRIKILYNFPKLHDLDDYYFEGLLKISIPLTVVIILLENICQEIEKGKMPYDFEKPLHKLVNIGLSKISKAERKMDSVPIQLLSRAILLLWEFASIGIKVSLIKNVLKIDGFQDIWTKLFTQLLCDPKLKHHDQTEILELFYKVAKFKYDIGNFQTKWNLMSNYLELPYSVNLFKEKDKSNVNIGDIIAKYLLHDVMNMENDVLKWQIVERVLRRYPVKFHGSYYPLPHILTWILKKHLHEDCKEPVLLIESDLQKLLSVFQISGKEITENELSVIYYALFCCTIEVNIKDSDLSFALMEWIYHKLLSHYISNAEHYYNAFILLFNMPLSMRYANLKKIRELATEFSKKNKDNKLETVGLKIALNWIIDPIRSSKDSFNSIAVQAITSTLGLGNICGFIESSTILLNHSHNIPIKFSIGIQEAVTKNAFEGINNIVKLIKKDFFVDLNQLNTLSIVFCRLIDCYSKEASHYINMLNYLDMIRIEVGKKEQCAEEYTQFILFFFQDILRLFNKNYSHEIKLFLQFGNEYISILSKYPPIVKNLIVKDPNSDYSKDVLKAMILVLIENDMIIPLAYRRVMNIKLLYTLLKPLYEDEDPAMQTLLLNVAEELKLKLIYESSVSQLNLEPEYVSMDETLRTMLSSLALKCLETLNEL